MLVRVPSAGRRLGLARFRLVPYLVIFSLLWYWLLNRQKTRGMWSAGLLRGGRSGHGSSEGEARANADLGKDKSDSRDGGHNDGDDDSGQSKNSAELLAAGVTGGSEFEKALKKEFEAEYDELGRATGTKPIYGMRLDQADASRLFSSEKMEGLTPSETMLAFTKERPYVFDPYVAYVRQADYVPCDGVAAQPLRDISVFRGHKDDFPAPSFGSYDVFGIEQDFCFERETRLGAYGFSDSLDAKGDTVDWDAVDWGKLQSQCTERNQARFASAHPSNEFVDLVYGRLSGQNDGPMTAAEVDGRSTAPTTTRNTARVGKKPRSAVLLRSYTGKEYSQDDKVMIRSLVAELSLRTGGEYEVFLLVQVKDDHLFGLDSTDQHILAQHVPAEFRSMTILWSEQSVRKRYPSLAQWDQLESEDWNKPTRVHNAQFLAVQLFMQQHREFDYVWNWEMDVRITGQQYDVLTKVVEFAKRQPRKYLWERNERFYIPSVHGDYDTDYRIAIEKQYRGRDSVWGPLEVPVIKPVGPKPPVATPEEDEFVWGVGEEADLITFNPMFNPQDSNWILRNQVWGFDQVPEYNATANLPRRVTIITQARMSRTLIDIMHVENLRGNHVGSEQVLDTVALLHGLKAVFAPIPVFFDRPWKGERLDRWFNGGPTGGSGGHGSAFGWGREVRFQGSTWFYRAYPPQRMYDNWLGYEDAGIGGARWEATNGRACLPALILHPVKDARPTYPGHVSDSKLPYPDDLEIAEDHRWQSHVGLETVQKSLISAEPAA